MPERLVRKFLLLVVIALSGCAGLTQPVGDAPGAAPRNEPAQRRANDRLVYVSDYGANALYAFSYETGDLIGSTSDGIAGPGGLCSDAKGNVWLANTDDSNMLEYAHGKTAPVQTLATSGEYPVACSVSPNGTLAVSAICSTESCGTGALLLYAGETGSPTAASCPNMLRYDDDAFDDSNNLFVTGENSSYAAELCEIRRGSRRGISVSLQTTSAFSSGVLWDGTYLALSDGDTIRRYAIRGSRAILEGTVSLSGSNAQTFVMDGKRIVVGLSGPSSSYDFWHYPQGGNRYKMQAESLSEPIGIALSPAPKL